MLWFPELSGSREQCAGVAFFQYFCGAVLSGKSGMEIGL